MEGISNPPSTNSGSLPPLTPVGYYPAPQHFNYNPHGAYYHQLALAYNPQQQGNTAAIQAQPTATITISRAVGDHYLTMSIALTTMSILFGTYSLICTIPALIFSILSRDAYKRGDTTTAITYGRIALRFNIGAMVTWVVAFAILLIIFVVLEG